MSPTALRWCAVPLGVLGFALRLAVTFWLQPLTWQLSLASGLLAIAAGMAVAVAIPFGIFWLLTGGIRQRPEAFACGDGRFTVPASPLYAGSQAMMWMFLSGGAVLTERVPNGDRMRMAEFGFTWPATVIGVGVFWVVALVILLIQRPQLHLESGGLVLRRFLRTTAIAWDELAPGGPLPPVKRRARRLRLYLNHTPMLGQYAASEDVPIGWLHIEPAFLARAIRHYVEHPQDRAAIGTEEGLCQLRAAMGASDPATARTPTHLT